VRVEAAYEGSETVVFHQAPFDWNAIWQSTTDPRAQAVTLLIETVPGCGGNYIPLLRENQLRNDLSETSELNTTRKMLWDRALTE
jgi:hypothetical protein